MPQPIQPGDKLTVSTRKSDAMALGWLNSQRNRSEAVMVLIRAAALQALRLTERSPSAEVKVRQGAPESRKESVSANPSEEGTFSGMAAFLEGLESFSQPDV